LHERGKILSIYCVAVVFWKPESHFNFQLQEQLWRYGWWDGKQVQTPEPVKDPELEEAKKEQEKEKLKSKKQFLEAAKKRREEMAKQANKEEASSSGDTEKAPDGSAELSTPSSPGSSHAPENSRPSQEVSATSVAQTEQPDQKSQV